jgi:hypothetical protein
MTARTICRLRYYPLPLTFIVLSLAALGREAVLRYRMVLSMPPPALNVHSYYVLRWRHSASEGELREMDPGMQSE